MSSGGNGDNQGAWLGLLKWSLAYTDGTRPSSETMQMSEEDRKFLEMVMKEGIVDEGERMKTILNDLTGSLDRLVKEAAAGTNTSEESKEEPEEEKTDTPELTEDDMVDLLEELRDIVEQIDYAKAFSALGGVPFLVGCASERGVVPKSVRSSCIAVLATLTQNNPHVQDIVLKSGALQTLADLFFVETPQGEEVVGQASASGGDIAMNEPDVDGNLRSKIVQAMSCSVRGHVEGERAFCASEGGRQVIECGLGLLSDSDDVKDDGMPAQPPVLRRRTLFFLQALITSDDATKERIELFNPCIQYVCTDMLSVETESDAEVRETGLGMLQRMIEQNNNVNMLAACKNAVVGVGIKRVSEIRKMDGEDKEFASYELELWEALIMQLARL
eukprot:CAMPEP_0197719288 /NCGR_PEP_ID=MMETSP1434-20131217/3109_1 /TAXON_ID=265543 /ORGANISM="Minutocellus polymorphus, Strain CCMP3303" /LENGTH=387 /DNA_ID=CAMNT_0043304025 /DNA_START=74 /DNA_END=1237 /DNA_ORIENTATION=-